MRSSTLTSTARASARALPVLRPNVCLRRPILVHSRSLQRCTAATALQETSTATEVTEVTADTMQHFLEDNSDGLTVVDFFTTWCGPCKLMNGVVEKLSTEFGSETVKFAKFDCSAKEIANNKGFALNLGITALPTFHIYRGQQKVAELIGAKPDQLRRLIAQYAPSHGRPIRRRAGASRASMASMSTIASNASVSSMG